MTDEHEIAEYVQNQLSKKDMLDMIKFISNGDDDKSLKQEVESLKQERDCYKMEFSLAVAREQKAEEKLLNNRKKNESLRLESKRLLTLCNKYRMAVGLILDQGEVQKIASKVLGQGK